MSKMFDTYEASMVQYNARVLKSKGYDAVGLYLFTQSKFKQRLTREIATSISGAGIYIVSVYESGSPTNLGYFTVPRGLSDGVNAVIQAKLAGQPSGSVIYFAVDTDIASVALPTIALYFKALRTAVLAAGYQVGAYGSGVVCSYLLTLKLVTKTWLAGASGWLGYEMWKTKCDILQGTPETLLGIDIDPDLTNGNAGGWMCK